MTANPGFRAVDSELAGWAEQLQAKYSRPRLLNALFGVALSCWWVWYFLGDLWLYVCVAVGIAFAVIATIHDFVGSRLRLTYDPESLECSRWSDTSSILEHLSQTRHIVVLDGDNRRGSFSFASRYTAEITQCRPRHLRVNVPVWGARMQKTQLPIYAGSGDLALFFLPDRIVVERDAVEVEAALYRNITASIEPIKFRELDSERSDARILMEGWLHQRVNGRPDRRFKYNPKVYEVEWWAARLRTSAGLDILLAFPQLDEAESIAGLAGSICRARYGRNQHGQREKEQQTSQDRSRTPPREVSLQGLDPYEVLGVERGCSLDVAAVAYKKLALKNHPDKVAHMDDAIREVAERRMKEINAAYEELKQTLSQRSSKD